jgi:general secretion pathway protein J
MSARNEGGFTLLELLIAVALLGLLTTILAAGLRLQTQYIERGSERLERGAQLPAVHAFLRSQLGKAQPVVPIGSADRTILFEGRPGAVAFVAPAPASMAGGGLELFSVGFAEGRVVVRWREFAGTLVSETQPGGETVLLDGVARARFRYFGTVPPEDAPKWHETWRGMPHLPALIRLELAFSDGEEMPVFAVAPRLAPRELSAPPDRDG